MSDPRQKYWFKVTFDKWEDEQFDPEANYIFVEAWSAYHAATKAEKAVEEGEVVISVEYLGYPQL